MLLLHMKKTSTRLQLKTTTVRLLQNSELGKVRGGEGEVLLAFEGNPSNNPTHCSASLHCDGGRP